MPLGNRYFVHHAHERDSVWTALRCAVLSKPILGFSFGVACGGAREDIKPELQKGSQFLVAGVMLPLQYHLSLQSDLPTSS